MSTAVALVLLPPPHISAVIDPLRSANDKSYARGWASHVTILFPFTPVDDLASLVDVLRLSYLAANLQPFDVKLEKVSRFATRDYETIYLGLSKNDEVQTLWNISVEAMKHPKDGRPYTPHLTLGQTARNPESIAFLSGKGNKILAQACVQPFQIVCICTELPGVCSMI
jgi:2'-5' RNA ligase